MFEDITSISTEERNSLDSVFPVTSKLNFADSFDSDDCSQSVQQKKTKETHSCTSWAWEYVTIILGFIELKISYDSWRTRNSRIEHSKFYSIDNYAFRFLYSLGLVFQAILFSWQKSRGLTNAKKAKRNSRERKDNPFVTCRSKRIKHENPKDYHVLVSFVSILACQIMLMPFFATFEKHQNQRTNDHSSSRTKSEEYFFLPHDYCSFLELLAMNIIPSLWTIFDTRLRHALKGIMLQIFKNSASYALTHPVGFHLRMKTLFTLIRWTKFLGPLIGALNKLKGHIQDGVKKYKQRRAKYLAQKKWDKLIGSMMQKKKLENAVLQIQKQFRRLKQEKGARRIRHLSLKRSIEQGRARQAADIFKKIEHKWIEEALCASNRLEQSEKLERERLKLRTVTTKDINTLKKHKTNLRNQQKLLIKPNTNFSVFWKILTVTCVMLEVSKLIMMRLDARESRTLHNPFFQYSSLPDRPVVNKGKKTIIKNGMGFVKTSKSTEKDYTSQQQQNIWTKQDGNRKVTRELASLLNFDIRELLFRHLSSLIAFVSFFDVFITFFTGEFSAKSGKLIPKPFFTRWLVPGIGLQLIVNPTMHGVILFLKAIVRFIHHTGLCRTIFIAVMMEPMRKKISEYFFDLLHLMTIQDKPTFQKFSKNKIK